MFRTCGPGPSSRTSTAEARLPRPDPVDRVGEGGVRCGQCSVEADHRRLRLTAHLGHRRPALAGDARGVLSQMDGTPLAFDGLWALLFVENELYFTAGLADEEHGLFGEIEADQ